MRDLPKGVKFKGGGAGEFRFYRPGDRIWAAVRAKSSKAAVAQVREMLDDYDSAPAWARVTKDAPCGVAIGAPFAGSRIVAIDWDEGSFTLADGRAVRVAAPGLPEPRGVWTDPPDDED